MMLPVIRKFNFEPVRHHEMVSPFNRLFEDIFGNETGQVHQHGAMDMYEDNENLHLDIELPGFTRDEIEVTLEDGVLQIDAEQKQPQTPQNSQVHYYYRQRGERKLSRKIQLPVPVEQDKVQATYNNGVLCMTLEKAGQAKLHKIEIN